jgi:hypothetical protein
MADEQTVTLPVTLPVTPRTEAEKALFGDVVEPGFTFDTENPEASLGQTIFQNDKGPQDKIRGKLFLHSSETPEDEAEWVTMWHPDGSTSKVPRGQVRNYVRKKNFLLRPPAGVVVQKPTVPCRFCKKMLRTMADREDHEQAFHPGEWGASDRERKRAQEDEQTELYRQLVSQGDVMRALLEQNRQMADELATLRMQADETPTTTEASMPRPRGRPPGH